MATDERERESESERESERESESNVVIADSRPASLVLFENMLQTHILHYESVNNVWVDGIAVKRNSSGHTRVLVVTSKRQADD